VNKERSESLTGDAEDKKLLYVAGTSSDISTSWKLITPHTVQDSFAPWAFCGTNANADT